MKLYVLLLLALSILLSCAPSAPADTTAVPESGSAALPDSTAAGPADDTTGAGDSGKDSEKRVFGAEGIEFEEKSTVVAMTSGSPYARIRVLLDGRFFCVWPEKDGGKRAMKGCFSSDEGKTWTAPKVLFYGEDQTKTLANADIIQLEDGEILVAYRSNDPDIPKTAGDFYSSIRVHSSKDNGETFLPHSIVRELQEHNVKSSVGLWEPCFGYLRGRLTCFYAIGMSVYKDPKIASTDISVWDEATRTWSIAEYESNDGKNTRKNGMPIWQPLSSGGYICSVETNRYKTSKGNILLPYLLYSADGVTWVDLACAYFPSSGKAVCGAPFCIELPDGRLAISFQSNEDALGTPFAEEGNSNNDKSIKVVLSERGVAIRDLRSKNFTAPFSAFRYTLGYTQVWSGMFLHGDYLYIYCGTNEPTGRIIMTKAKLPRA